jgi:predicted benzoate:H+ symporter BenE
LAWTYLATTRTGRTYVVVTALAGSALAGSAPQPIDANRAGPALLSAMKGAFILAAGK